MGGIADYSGSLVLQWPLREATLAALQLDPEPRVRVVSLGAEANGRDASFEIPLDALLPGGQPLTTTTRARCWRATAAASGRPTSPAALLVLARERGLRSDVRPAPADPLGRAGGQGRQLVRGAGGRDDARDGRRLWASRSSRATWRSSCQKVENLVVGAPCGVMDQMTAACGRAGELLVLLCQPAELRGTLAVPDEIEIWGIDSQDASRGVGLGLRTRAGGRVHGRSHPGGANRPAPLAGERHAGRAGIAPRAPSGGDHGRGVPPALRGHDGYRDARRSFADLRGAPAHVASRARALPRAGVRGAAGSRR